MSRFVRIGGGFLLVIIAGLGVLAYWARTAARPKNLGVRNGQLAACPSTPNCVTTQQGLAAQRMPPLSFTGDVETAKARLLAIIGSMPRTIIVANEPTYLAAEFRSELFKFTDDVEFVFDTASQQIHFRSAARVGYGDHDVNRNRMTEISRQFQSGS